MNRRRIRFFLSMSAFPTRIYLTGFMGSGKSTIGPMVANVLGYAFVDLDEVIVQTIGQPIPEFFRTHGEAAFRRVEAAVLSETVDLVETVISLGGGALVSDANLRTVHELGLIVYLKWSAESLTRRLARSTNRPMLHDEHGHVLKADALRQRIETLLAVREPFYEQADLVVELDGCSVGWSVDRVVSAIREWVRDQRRRQRESRKD